MQYYKQILRLVKPFIMHCYFFFIFQRWKQLSNLTMRLSRYLKLLGNLYFNPDKARANLQCAAVENKILDLYLDERD